MIPVYKAYVLERWHQSIYYANQNDLCEQKELRKNPSGWSEHIIVQQRCNFLDKKLKEIEGVNNLESVDPKELSLVPDLVIPPKFKVLTFEKYDGTKCPENHLVTYCRKTTRHTHNECLLIHVFYDSLTGAATRWYMKLKKDKFVHVETSSGHFWKDTKTCWRQSRID